MTPEILALVEIYEYEPGSTTNKTSVNNLIFKYCGEKFPTPKDIAEYLERTGQEAARQKGIKAKVSVEMPNTSPAMNQLRKKGIIIDRVFIVNLFVE